MKPNYTNTSLITTTILILVATSAPALEPPTAEQLERYSLDGSLAERAEAARAYGNHRMSPQLAARFAATATTKALPDGPKVLPPDGSPRVLTLLIAFEDMPGYTDPTVVDDRIFGDGEASAYPYESLTSFYRRASYGQLEIAGSALGWYTTPYPREDVTESYVGRQTLIKEVITHYDTEGHDFSQYDNDGDGTIDYLAVIWTGAHGEWAEFWWGYQTSFWNDEFTVDGVQIGTYSWQWENYAWPGEFSPEVLIHETGHALGLPDYYDYDDAIGPRGGAGGLDQMDSNWGDHNAFSKWVLGWLTPEIYNQDSHELTLAPSDSSPEAAVLMHGNPVVDPYSEYFIIQHRRREGNDVDYPNNGLLIWHVDARTDAGGNFLYDNSYTEHKLLRLMEADGLEEIHTGGRADAGDFFVPGDLFDAQTTPNSNRHDGVPTNIAISSITESVEGLTLHADLGSGCALWCDASVTPNAWPGLPVTFNGSLDTANCDGSPSYGWVFGDGASSGDTTATHAYVSTGAFQWSVTASVEDAICSHQGSVVVCTDFPCWQWAPTEPMAAPRSQHAAVDLVDGRILVVGGTIETPEIYDPQTMKWSPAAPTNSNYTWAEAVRLDDGRVLVCGEADSEIYDPNTDSWTVAGQLNHPRLAHSAITLSDGRVLVAGGVWGEYPHFEAVESVEVFDPATGIWTVIDTLTGVRVQPGTANLLDGTTVIVGAREVTRFDPISDLLQRAAPLPAEWQQPVAVTLDDGQVLMAGIANGPMTLLWNPTNGRWKIADPALTIRSDWTASKLANGLVLVAGGHGGGDSALALTEFFDPADLSWKPGSALVHGRMSHTATVMGDGRLVLIGGRNNEDGPYYTAIEEVEILTRPTTPPRGIGGRITP